MGFNFGVIAIGVDEYMYVYMWPKRRVGAAMVTNFVGEGELRVCMYSARCKNFFFFFLFFYIVV